eukprot:363759-Chlamydomonas_euryale.AAC.33
MSTEHMAWAMHHRGATMPPCTKPCIVSKGIFGMCWDSPAPMSCRVMTESKDCPTFRAPNDCTAPWVCCHKARTAATAVQLVACTCLHASMPTSTLKMTAIVIQVQ